MRKFRVRRRRCLQFCFLDREARYREVAKVVVGASSRCQVAEDSTDHRCQLEAVTCTQSYQNRLTSLAHFTPVFTKLLTKRNHTD